MLEESTHDLVRRAQAGNADAFQALVERLRERLERQIDSRMGAGARERLEPADVLQETFTKAFESISYFEWRGEESFYRWLGSIAEHLIWNTSKKKRPMRLRLDPADRSDASARRRLQRDERFNRLKDAVADLTPEQREAILLARIDGLSLGDVAARMGRTPGAVQKLIARALLALRQSFSDAESLSLPHRSLRDEEHAEDE